MQSESLTLNLKSNLNKDTWAFKNHSNIQLLFNADTDTTWTTVRVISLALISRLHQSNAIEGTPMMIRCLQKLQLLRSVTC